MKRCGKLSEEIGNVNNKVKQETEGKEVIYMTRILL